MSVKITCKQAVDLLSKKEEGKLSATSRFRLWQHLAACSLCRIFSTQNKIISEAFRQMPEEDSRLSEHDKTKLVDAVLNKNA